MSKKTTKQQKKEVLTKKDFLNALRKATAPIPKSPKKEESKTISRKENKE